MNTRSKTFPAKDEFIHIPLVALEDLPAMAAAKATKAAVLACQAHDEQARCDDSIRLAWALPILTGSVDDVAEKRTLALAMALGYGLGGREAIDVAIGASAPEMLVCA